MWKYFLKYIFVTIFFSKVVCQKKPDNVIEVAFKKPVLTTANYVFWPNATVPFYVNPDHFDHEQSLSILQTLSMFAFRTCLKFAPVMAKPASNEHVLVLENPAGIRRCVFDTLGHSVFEPHRVVIGYDCLRSPQIDLIIMRSLGFPFEHNRMNRDVYINILEENIEPSYIDLFTKETAQPIELRAIPYDVNSVMHFGVRDFSKNGHRTIMFKDHNTQQFRLALTKLDLRKIEVVYGPQCRARDREEKIQLCQSYPGVARKKREVETEDKLDVSKRPEINRKKRDEKSVLDLEISSQYPKIVRKKRDVEIVTKSLRVNPEITPPPDAIKQTLTELGIDDAVQEVVEQVYKVSALALNNARQKYCNNTKPDLRTIDDKDSQKNTDILGIIELIAHYAQGIVEHAVANLTKFCEESETIEVYQRARCSFYEGGDRCRQSYYKSTKSGNVRYSTQHRPVYIQSTNIRGLKEGKNIYGRFRASNDSEETTTEVSRRKRAVEEEEKKDNPSLEIQGRKDEQDKHDHVDTEKKDKKELDKYKEEEKEKDIEVKKKEDKNEEDDKALRAGTGIPILKSHRYEAVRRRSRSRVKYAANEEDFDRSSLSTETERPQENREPEESQKYHRQSIKTKKRDQSIEQESEHRQSMGDERRSQSDESKREEEEKERDSSNEVRTSKYTTKAEVRWKRRTKKREEEREYREIEKATERYQHKTERDDTIPDIVTLSKANRDFYNDRKWPGGVVRYIINEDSTYDTNDLRRRLAEVNSILKKKTCVRLKEITEGQAQHIDDYVVIDNSPDYVTGRVGGRQNFGSIELFRGDQHRQHTAMMVMAMLGFYFEVSRHDRDKYVRVHLRHVRPDKLHHFEKIRKDATLPLPYDYASATQPAWQYWRQLGRTGISTVATYKQQDPDGSVMKSMGQNSKLLSDIDIVKINSVYGNKCLNSLRSQPKKNETLSLPSKKTLKKSKRGEPNREVTIALK